MLLIFFKNIKPSDLTYHGEKNDHTKFKNEILNNIFYLRVSDYEESCYVSLNFHNSKDSEKYNYDKFLELFINNLDNKNKTICLNSAVVEDLSDDILNNINKSFILYFKKDYLWYTLIITNDIEKYKVNLKSIRDWRWKILYYKNNKKSKKYTDLEAKEINQSREYLKNISYDDITFTTRTREFFFMAIRGFDDKHELIPNPFFDLERDRHKVYFGKLRNRYHVGGGGISSFIRGIGLGYKIYKAFLKYQGYLISDMQSSESARKIYYNLMKDSDVYYVIDKENRSRGGAYGRDSQKVLLIWKNFNRLEKLISIIRKTDIKFNRKYDYDPELKQKFNNLFQ